MKPHVCTHCHTYHQHAYRSYRGETSTEVLGWIFGIILTPIGIGVFILMFAAMYSALRAMSQAGYCPSCGSDALVPTSTPVGQKILATLPANPQMQEVEATQSAVSVFPSTTGIIIFLCIVIVTVPMLLYLIIPHS